MDHFEKERGFALTREEGRYCVLWWGPNAPAEFASDRKNAREFVEQVDAWRLRLIGELGFSTEKTAEEQNQYKYKLNVYLTDSGQKVPADGHYLGTYPNSAYAYLVVARWSAPHEFGHYMEMCSGGFRENPLVGWGWESAANYIANHLDPGSVDGSAMDYFKATYRRMDSFANNIQYKSWPWWLFLELTYGPKTCGTMWTTAAKDVPQFEQAALVTGKSIAEIFTQFAKACLTFDFGPRDSKRLKNAAYVGDVLDAGGNLKDLAPVSRTGNVLTPSPPRMEMFAFDTVDLGTAAGKGMWRAKVINATHTVEDWGVVFVAGDAATILRPGTFTPQFAGAQKKCYIAVVCATRMNDTLRPDYRIELEAVAGP